MFSILRHRIIISVVLILFLSGIIIQLRLAHFYKALIAETENMAATKVELLYQCKKKFSNCYRLHNGVLNVSVFVDKYLCRIKMGRFSVGVWKHLSGQLVLLSVFVAGIGACMGIIEGNTLGDILPFYIISMLDLYFYFAITGFTDIEEKKRVLKIHLVDYLENHMGNKLEDLEYSMKRLDDVENTLCQNSKAERRENILSNKSDKAELEELLREFLA